jgi:hypothetical protein
MHFHLAVAAMAAPVRHPPPRTQERASVLKPYPSLSLPGAPKRPEAEKVGDETRRDERDPMAMVAEAGTAAMDSGTELSRCGAMPGKSKGVETGNHHG